MNKKLKTLLIIEILEKEYPNAKCTLNFKNETEFLVASILSAQCTDIRVNVVTQKLFKEYKNTDEFAKADISEIERIIKPCGLYKTKAKNIVNMCRYLKENYDSKIPNTLQKLIKLPGIGRKIANLILGEIFEKPCIIVDTHCFRITKRLALQNEKTPNKAEQTLKKILPKNKSHKFCHRLVAHGRLICKAKTPKCGKCCLLDFCKTKFS
ncbi:MAG: endonuclease III [Oscillospiraceae bacterium]|jgi:endonuclease-3|nr:endonuclease III [Oscillospiraceae bacterium]